MELQHLDIFQDNVRGRSILFVSYQLLITLHDVTQLVGQVVLKEAIGIGFD